MGSAHAHGAPLALLPGGEEEGAQRAGRMGSRAWESGSVAT